MTLWLDLETFCLLPITVGTHRYAELVEILLVAYAIDDGPVQVVAFDREELQALIDRADKVVIHNSAFDRTVLRHCGVDLPIEKVEDTMVLALLHALPGSLGKLCEVFRLPVDQAKDKEGKQLIRLFCMPRPKNSKIRRATAETHPKEWEAFKAYAALDVEAMRAIYKKLPKWNNTKAERELWELDQVINDRGFQVDLELVHGALRAVARAQRGLSKRAQDLTGGAVLAATQGEALKQYIFQAFGISLDDMQGSTVEKLLENDAIPTELREILAVRLQASTASVAKYGALEKATSKDGRLRGTIQFAGASRTSRAAGRIFQPQNLMRPNMKQADIDIGIEAMKLDAEDLLFENVMEVAANAMRGTIIAPPGRKLVIADLSTIEGRVLVWLSGEQWKLDAFTAYDQGVGADLYKVTAGRILGKAPDDVTKKERQEVGKVAELALGFGGGVGAFSTFATAYGIDLSALAAAARENLPVSVVKDSESLYEFLEEKKVGTHGLERSTWVGIDAIKRAWRQTHPATSEFWKDLERAAFEAIAYPGRAVQVGRLLVEKRNAWLLITLPSGRSLCYAAPSVTDGKLTYMGVNQFTRRFERISSYGGKLAENCTQAVARDVLYWAMPKAEAAGYSIVLHVHDELLTETPDVEEYSAGELSRIMAAGTPWSTGLPLAAAGFETTRYRKD